MPVLIRCPDAWSQRFVSILNVVVAVSNSNGANQADQDVNMRAWIAQRSVTHELIVLAIHLREQVLVFWISPRRVCWGAIFMWARR